MNDITPRWLSVQQAGAYASMSRPTIMKHITAGNFVAKKDGKWRVDRESIDRYLSSDSEDYTMMAKQILQSVRAKRRARGA